MADFDQDEIEELYRKAVLVKKGESRKQREKEIQSRRKKKKYRLNYFKFGLFIVFIASTVFFAVLVTGMIGKAVSGQVKKNEVKSRVNDKLVDNVVFKENIEDVSGVNLDYSAKSSAEKSKEILTGGIVNGPKTNTEVLTPDQSETLKTVKTTETSGLAKQEKITESAVKQPEIKNIPAKGSYTIQVAAGKVEDSTKKMVEEIKSKGYEAYYIKEGKMFRVLIGKFDDRAKANEFGNSLVSKKIIKYFYPRFIE